MNIARTWQTKSSKSEDTFAIGEQLGRACKGGEFFLLSSDLGGGKTTFTKGLAKGLGSQDIVTSPTFMVSRVYKCGNNISLHHFDFYRLHEGGMVAHELSELINDSNAVIVVEWGDVIGNTLPADRIEIHLDRMAEAEDVRCLSAVYPSKFDYLFTSMK